MRWGVTLLILAAVGAYLYRKYSDGAVQPVTYESVEVKRGTVINRVSATGVLSALVTVQVGSQVSGRISELMVDFNSEVQAGQVLARIDPEPFEADLARAEADVAAARASVTEARASANDAERTAKRARALADKALIAVAEAESAESQAEVARARVESARARLRQSEAALDKAKSSLAYTTIVSPIDGVVISRDVDAGQTVAASLQAPTLFLIAEDMKRMQVNTSVSEADVGKMRDGMRATFRVDAYPDDVFVGQVRQIRNAPVTVQNVVTYDAVIDVENPDLKLRPGMTANVSFEVAVREDVITVSNAALRFRPTDDMVCEAAEAPTAEKNDSGSAAEPARAQRRPGGGGAGSGRGRPGGGGAASARSGPRQLWLLRDGKPHCVMVVTGLSDGSVTEISGPVQPGDVAITVVNDPNVEPDAAAGAPGAGGSRRGVRLF